MRFIPYGFIFLTDFKDSKDVGVADYADLAQGHITTQGKDTQSHDRNTNA